MFTEKDLEAVDSLMKVVCRLRLSDLLDGNEIVSMGRILLHVENIKSRIEKSICDERAKALMAQAATKPIEQPPPPPAPKKGKK